MTTKIRKSKISLRLKLALASIIILFISCGIAYFIVFMGFSYLYSGPITSTVALYMCLITCAITMILGGVALWHSASYIMNPIVEISKGIQKVAEGDFTVQLSFNNIHRRKNELYSDEIDVMAENFNKMTRELNGMDYMRKDFMSNVSHEIKTPVAAIAGFSEMLLDGGLSEQEQKEYLSYIYQESQRLSRMSENMLHMSRLDNQNIVDLKQEVKVDEQIRRCIILLEEKWCDKDIQYELDLEKCSMASNYDLLFQLWTNLIDNAIKYSGKKCTIWIATKVIDNFLKFTIRDEGIGISKEKLSKIYDKFYQCDESHKRLGNGLGLSIVKRIIELLNGNILCESEVGVGTTMTVILPIQKF
ncbi:HAMP domain-containing sensor histidine kinase [Ruminiclostridium josui]|uniref:HAMP domain-containing sensor histidine kinase n=1 Tax=Ruminiclostridium josui TaxID=1499 RepID=UPI00054E7201|nr:HAMP domain-containing sensor histidine kinase [Ruminiclostridium josui]